MKEKYATFYRLEAMELTDKGFFWWTAVLPVVLLDLFWDVLSWWLRTMAIKPHFFLITSIKFEVLFLRCIAHSMQVTSTELGQIATSELLIWRLWDFLTNRMPVCAWYVLNAEKYYGTPIWKICLEFSITACFLNHQNCKNLFETDLICLNYLCFWIPAAMNSCLIEEALLLCWIVLTPETIRPSFEIKSFMSIKFLDWRSVVFQCWWVINLQVGKEQKLLLTN